MSFLRRQESRKIKYFYEKNTYTFFITNFFNNSFGGGVKSAADIGKRLKGRLLLNVQDGGTVWYVDNTNYQRHQVKWDDALPIFQKFALGISDEDLLKTPVTLESIRFELDTDGDGYTDRQELENGYSPYVSGSYKGKFKTDKNFANRLKNKFLLQVNQGGAIWYVDNNGIRFNVRWDNLRPLFESLALGITSDDLEKIWNDGDVVNNNNNDNNDDDKNSRDALRISDIKQIMISLELFFNENNNYPISSQKLILGNSQNFYLCDGGIKPESYNCGGNSYSIPLDPKNDIFNYTYESLDGKDYIINFNLEIGAGGLNAGQFFTDSSGAFNIK